MVHVIINAASLTSETEEVAHVSRRHDGVGGRGAWPRRVEDKGARGVDGVEGVELRCGQYLGGTGGAVGDTGCAMGGTGCAEGETIGERL